MTARTRPACPTRRYLSGRPRDLVTWAQAAEAIAQSPHPMSERNLRRLYRMYGGCVYRLVGVRGELVSRTAVFEWHRNYWRGWSQAPARPPARR